MKVRTVAVWLVGALAFVLFAAASAFVWRWYQLPARVGAALPAEPADLASKSAELERRVVEAGKLAHTRFHALEGVADLGLLYHANGYLANAETCWRLLRAEEPKNARWCYYLADLRRTAGDDDAVATLLGETVHLAPDYAPAWLKLADLEFKTGRMKEAGSHYQRRLALVPKDPYARLGLARIAMQRGERADARKRIEEIVKDNPEFPPAHNLYAEMLAADGKADAAFQERALGRETGRFREADDPWMDELNDSCLDPKRLSLLATMAYQARRGDRGESYLRRAVDLAPGDPANYELLGTLYLQLGKPKEAQTVFEKGLSLPRKGSLRVMLQVNLAESFRLQQKSADALEVVRKGLIADPDAYELNSELGAVLIDLGRIEDAVTAYRKTLTLVPNDADANFSLGSALLALGRRSEAVGYLKHSLTLQPTYPRSLILLGRLALESGEMEDARRYLGALYDSHPEQSIARNLYAQYHLVLGEAAAKRGDAKAAEKWYRKGLAIDPDHPELNVSLGVLCLLQGRLDDALGPFEAFHRLRPEDPQSSLFLGQLYAQLGRFGDARKILTSGMQLAERTGNRDTANHCREILQHLPPG